VEAARELSLVWNVALTEIGEFEAGPPAVWLRTAAGRKPLDAVPHDHFRGPSAAW
jgi:hypothetical protein